MKVTLSPKKLQGSVKAPPSKSYMHRALICASLLEGETEIECSGFSEDIRATASCLENLGAKILIGDGKIVVGTVKRKDSVVTIDCKESGSTLRFMLPFVAALGQSTVITGAKRLGERPLAPLCEAILGSGAEVSCENGASLPCVVKGKMQSGNYSVKANISSQFVSGLIMALAMQGGTVTAEGEIVSAPYINMTLDVMNTFGIKVVKNANTFEIEKKSTAAPKHICAEGDFSNAAFWIVAGVIGSGEITCENLSQSTKQGDIKIVEILRQMGGDITFENSRVIARPSHLTGTQIDAENIPDLVPVLCVAAACADGQTVIKNISRLREKESDRVESTMAMLRALGGDIRCEENSLIIKRSKLHTGEVDSFNDHRIAMAAAVASVAADGSVTINGAEAVKKSYPDFFEKFHSLEVRV